MKHFWGHLLAYALGLAVGFAGLHWLATTEPKQVREYHGDELVHDGWCSLMPNCLDRCHCHDRCGPLCNTWRRLVADGVVEPWGYEWTLNDPTGLVECIIWNSMPEEKRREAGRDGIRITPMNDPNAWKDTTDETP